MTYQELLDKICTTGIEGARQSYGEGTPRFEGSQAGFESCRGQAVPTILRLHGEAVAAKLRARREGDPIDDYWRLLATEMEIEWVLNCLSVGMGVALLPHLPTARAVMHVSTLLGVAA